MRMGTHTNDSRINHKSMGIKQSDTERIREWKKDSWSGDIGMKSREEEMLEEDVM